jgi:hypothetical protein
MSSINTTSTSNNGNAQKKRKHNELDGSGTTRILTDKEKEAIRQQFWNASTQIFVGGIFPFVGPGQFALVAGVGRHFRDAYKTYVSAVQDSPCVLITPTDVYPDFNPSRDILREKSRPAVSTDTFYSAAFASVSCAEFWDADTKGEQPRDCVCSLIAKDGNLSVLQWARNEGFSIGWLVDS